MDSVSYSSTWWSWVLACNRHTHTLCMRIRACIYVLPVCGYAYYIPLVHSSVLDSGHLQNDYLFDQLLDWCCGGWCCGDWCWGGSFALIIILKFYLLSNTIIYIIYTQLLMNSRLCQLLTIICQQLCTAQQVKFNLWYNIRLPTHSLRYCLLLKS